MDLTLKVWRQPKGDAAGEMKTYLAKDISPHMSFLEMLDTISEELIERDEDPIHFDSDCREGICGTCSMVINGVPHGPQRATTACQLHMREFRDGDTITIEPWRAKAFPVVKDLVVDRSSFDRILQKGGFVSNNTGGAPDANAMLFVAAKVAQYAHLPQGQPERATRVISMVAQMDEEGFGACTNTYECEAACPKEIPVAFIAEMNRDYLKSKLVEK